MSLLKKMGTAVKSAVNNAADQMQERKERRQAKRAILNHLELSQVKNLCKQYGAGQPRSYDEDFLTGERTKRKVTREHWINFAMENVLLDQIIAFCSKRRIKIEHLLPQEKTPAPEPAKKPVKEQAKPQEASRQPSIHAPRGPPPNMKALLQNIQRSFEPETTRDEHGFETQLTVWLKHRFPGQVQRQVGHAKGRVDLVLFDEFAIELKIAENMTQLRNLIGQIHGYKKEWKHVGIILLDVGVLKEAVIQEFVQDYEGLGVPTIVIGGEIKRKKSQEWVMKKR